MVMRFWRIDEEGDNRDLKTDEQAAVHFRKVGRRMSDVVVVNILKFKDQGSIRSWVFTAIFIKDDHLKYSGGSRNFLWYILFQDFRCRPFKFHITHEFLNSTTACNKPLRLLFSLLRHNILVEFSHILDLQFSRQEAIFSYKILKIKLSNPSLYILESFSFSPLKLFWMVRIKI